MSPLIKLAVGLAGTSLVALAAYKLARAPLLSDLGSRSAEVMVANGITDGRVNWVTPAGWTFRTARLSGTADPATRLRTRDAVAALTGIHDAFWEDDRHLAATDRPNGLAIDIVDCQTHVDAINQNGSILFGASDATIAATSLRQVDAIAQTLLRCPGAAVTIIGFPDKGGAAVVDLALSQARAEAMAAALAARGIAAGRLVATRSGAADRHGQPIQLKLQPGAIEMRGDRETRP